MNKIPWADMPTVEGWYWMNARESFPEDYTCVYIRVNEKGGRVIHDRIPERASGGTPLAEWIEHADYYFAGPLPEPDNEEPDDAD